MIRAGVLILCGTLGCAAPRPAPREAPAKATLQACVDILIENPGDPRGRALFPSLLQEDDDRTMSSMRLHHGTGENALLHDYRSHLWIHPFLRGCRASREGDAQRARTDFDSARSAALKGDSSRLAVVIAQQSRLRLEELQPGR